MVKKYSIKDLQKNKFSLVLSGGSSYGIGHIGIIKFLEENHLVPDEIIGTSMGAIIGAFYSVGKTSSEIEKIVMRARRNQLLKKIFFGSSNKRKFAYDLLEENYSNKKMKEALIDLKIICVDVETGKGRVFTKKDDITIFKAVKASSAIPGLIPSVKIGEKYYVDGGVFSNLPVEYAKKKNIKIGVNAVFTIIYHKFVRKEGFFSRIFQRISTLKHSFLYLLDNQTQIKIKFIKKLIFIQPNLNKFNSESLMGFKKMISICYKEINNYFKG